MLSQMYRCSRLKFLNKPANFKMFIILIVTLEFLLSITAIKSGLHAQDKFHVIISADPQFVWTLDPNLPEKERIELAKIEIVSQYRSMDKLMRDVLNTSPVKGLIVNGDLTNLGRPWQRDDYNKLLMVGTQIPTHLGLGNHDYCNLVDKCYLNNCASPMVTYMWDRIQMMKPPSYNFFVTSDISGTVYQGSMAYSFDINDVHFIQLQNYPTYVREWSGGFASRNRFTIMSSMGWLESDLINARNKGQTIIINMHDYWQWIKDKPKIDAMFEKYGVTAVFSGHTHEIKVRFSSSIPNITSGSASTHDYLLVEFDKKTDKMTVSKIKNTLEGTYKVENTLGIWAMKNYTPNTPIAPLVPPTKITFFNQGWFDANFELSYTKKDGNSSDAKTGTMTMNQKRTYVLPAGTSNVHVKGIVNIGSGKEVFNKTFPIPPNECFRLYGDISNSEWDNKCN